MRRFQGKVRGVVKVQAVEWSGLASACRSVALARLAARGPWSPAGKGIPFLRQVTNETGG
jgi:hypothetical protein